MLLLSPTYSLPPTSKSLSWVWVWKPGFTTVWREGAKYISYLFLHPLFLFPRAGERIRGKNHPCFVTSTYSPDFGLYSSCILRPDIFFANKNRLSSMTCGEDLQKNFKDWQNWLIKELIQKVKKKSDFRRFYIFGLFGLQYDLKIPIWPDPPSITWRRGIFSVL